MRRIPATARNTILLATLLLVAAGSASAQGTPKRKPGLWQQTVATSGPGIPPQSMSMCVDERTDDLMMSRADAGQQCTPPSVSRQGSGYTFETQCRQGATTVRMRGSFTGDFNTRYSGELRSTFEPPMHGMAEMTQKIDARWVGPCKPGQKPGDVMVEGMGAMNMNEMMNADPAKMKEMMQQMQQNRAK